MAAPINPAGILLLVQAGAPELPLHAGARLVARVVDRGHLNLAGATLPAQLPEEVVPGQTLRLEVAEAGNERLHLRIVDEPPLGLPLPGGAQAFLRPDRDAEPPRPGEPVTVSLIYESPRLGPIGLRLSTAGATVTATPAAFTEVEAAADELRARLGLPVTVRPAPFDAYA